MVGKQLVSSHGEILGGWPGDLVGDRDGVWSGTAINTTGRAIVILVAAAAVPFVVRLLTRHDVLHLGFAVGILVFIAVMEVGGAGTVRARARGIGGAGLELIPATYTRVLGLASSLPVVS